MWKYNLNIFYVDTLVLKKIEKNNYLLFYRK